MESKLNYIDSIRYERTLSLSKKNGLFSIHLFIFGILASLLLILIPSSYYSEKVLLIVKILSLITFTLCAASSVRFDLSHPFVWFNFPFLFYSISAPVLYLLGELEYYPTLAETLNLEYIAILSSAMVIGTTTYSYRNLKIKNLKFLLKGNNWFFLMSLMLSLLYLCSIIILGVKNKGHKVVYFSPFLALDFAYYFIGVSVSIYIISNWILGKKLSFWNILFFSSYLIFSFLICGERDILFRFVLLAVMLYHILYKKVKLLYLSMIFLAMLFLATISGHFKMLLVTGQMSGDFQNDMNTKSVITKLLGSELITASQNLARILEYIPEKEPFFMGETIWWDIKRALVPGFLFQRDTFINTSTWFTKTMFPNYWKQGMGVGFTIVGVGYINFGAYGVIGIFILIGFVLNWIYRWSAKTVFGLLFYISFMPVCLISIRGDLSAPISRSIKHILIPLFLIILIGSFKDKISKFHSSNPQVAAIRTPPPL
jgi:hypothetical protein